jgi:hypothetical protein
VRVSFSESGWHDAVRSPAGLPYLAAPVLLDQPSGVSAGVSGGGDHSHKPDPLELF